MNQLLDKGNNNIKLNFHFYTNPVTFYTKAYVSKIWYMRNSILYKFLI